MTGGLLVLPLAGLGEIIAGDDLGALIAAAAGAGPGSSGSIGGLADGDIVVVSSKVVSKALGLSAPAAERDAVIAAESLRLVARRRTPHGLASIVHAAAGPVMAAAGVDNSNVAAGTVLLLPADPDHQAAVLRARLMELTGVRLGVVVSDTAGRAWRDGQTDLALGAAGVAVTDDLRGTVDTHGQPMEVTVRAVADQIAAAADLVKGKLRSVPVAVLRGLGELVLDDDGPGAAVLLRPPGQDWFRLGHVEAVRASLGVDPSAVEPPAVPPDDVSHRLSRVLEVALHSTPNRTGEGPAAADSPGAGAGAGSAPTVTAHAVTALFVCAQSGGQAEVRLTAAQAEASDWFDLGVLAQRIRAAAWSEDLSVHITPKPGAPPSLHVEASTSR